MRRAILPLALLAFVAGCGGGSKQAPQLTRQQYAAALNKLCSGANRKVAALKLTTAMQTWKHNGQRAAKIADQTVKGFEALSPPEDLQSAADRYNKASEQIAKAVRDAADAAKNGDTNKYDDA